MSDFHLDTVIDRRAVPALKTHKMVVGEGGENLFAAGVADMDFAAPPAVLRALQMRLDHEVFGYEAMPDGLMPALTGWLANQHNWQVEAAHILRAPNVLNTLAIAVSLFTKKGDGVIVQPPVFFDFYDIIAENERKLLANPLILTNRNYVMDFDGLETLASDPKTKMIFLCNPHNPVGRVWNRVELQRLGDICARHNVLVVADEIHGDITYPGHDYTPFAALGAAYANNSITCLSPAKSFNIAACCTAFTVVPNDARRAAFHTENSRLTVNKNNAFASAAMEAAYRDGGPWLADVLAYIEGNLALVRKALAPCDAVDLIEPDGTFLLWLDFRALGLTPDALTAFLREKAGWAVTRGQAFGAEGAGFSRLNIATTRSNLKHALTRLIAALIEIKLEKPESKMTDITVYDPAMCCSTGICGAEVDQNLVTFAADLDWLKSSGVSVKRINLSQEPAEFAVNAVVKTVLENDGVGGLPVILVNGNLKSSGRYPDRAELASLADITFVAMIENEGKSGGCCNKSISDCC